MKTLKGPEMAQGSLDTQRMMDRIIWGDSKPHTPNKDLQMHCIKCGRPTKDLLAHYTEYHDSELI